MSNLSDYKLTISTNDDLSLTGNITGANLIAGSSGTGNVYAGNVIVNGQPTTYGTVNPAFIVVGLASSVTGLANGQTIILDTVVGNTNSQLSYNSSTGVFTLTAGVTYDMSFTPSFITFSNTTTGFMCYDWVDATTNAPLDTTGIGTGTGISSQDTTAQQDNATARIIYKPTTNQTVKLRVSNANGTVTLRGGIGTQAIVRPLNLSIAVQATATGTVSATVVANTSPVVTSTNGGSSTSPGLTILTLAIPTAGTWRLDAELRVSCSDGGYVAVAFYDNGTLIPNSEYWLAGGATNNSNAGGGQYSGFMSYNLTTTDARTVTVGIWSTSSAAMINSPDGRTWARATRLDSVFALNALDTMSVTGNVSANYFIGNGSQLTGITAGTNYTNSNVATFLASFGSNTLSTTGNVSAGNIIGTLANGNSNVSIATANGNVTISSAGNTTMTITGTGAIITGIAKPTGTSVTGVNSVLAGPTFTPLANTMGGFVSNVNSYTQLTIQNKNTGSDATTDFIATADNGSDTVNYLDMGIINSGYDALTPTNSLGNIVYAADSYIYAQGNTSAVSQSGGNLAIGTTVAGKTVKIFAGGVTASNVVATVANTGVTVTGNVTATKFVGDGSSLTNVTVSVAGNVIGTTSNVSLVAGSFTATFDNTGVLTLPTNGGDEGGELRLGVPATNTTLTSRVTVDVYQDRFRIFDGSTKGVYIDLSQASSGVGTLLNNRVSGLVNAGTFVTMDLIKATVTTSGNRGLSLATTTGTFACNIGGTYATTTPSASGSAGTLTITTTASSSIFNWSFPNQGDISTYILTDTTNSRAYRITLQIGASFNNNMISIERLI